MEAAAIIAVVNILVPIAIRALQESKEYTEDEKAAMLVALMTQNAALAKAVAAYRPLPTPKKVRRTP